MKHSRTPEASGDPSASTGSSAAPPGGGGGSGKATPLTAHVRIAGFGAAEDGALFAELAFHHRDGERTGLLPLSGLTPAAKAFDRLTERGARLVSPAARRELIGRIQAVPDQRPTFAVATRLGWHGRNLVLPYDVLGPGRRALPVHLDEGRSERLARYRVHGTLEGFGEIGGLAVGNSLMEMALCLGLEGAVAPVMGLDQAIVMIVGPPESGKSTVAMCPGAAWGRHIHPGAAAKLGFGVHFNATGNDLENEALAANHTFLLVDETRTLGGDDRKHAEALLELGMRWDFGLGKGRMTEDGPRRSTSVPLLLTSNKSLGELAAKAGLEVDDAHHGRLICVPLPEGGQGAFEDLHGHADVAALCKRLRALMAEHFGVAAREFLHRLVDWRARDEEGLKEWLGRRRASFLRHAERIAAPERSIDRVRQKFATLYAAGCLAIAFGILPWERKRLRQGLLACVRGHVALVARDRAQSAAGREGALVERLYAHVGRNLGAFVDLRRGGMRDTSGHDHDNCPGYLNVHDKNGLEYLFSDPMIERIAGSRARAKQLKAELVELGRIAVEAGGGGIGRFSVRRAIGRTRSGKPDRRQVIAIRVIAFG